MSIHPTIRSGARTPIAPAMMVFPQRTGLQPASTPEDSSTTASASPWSRQLERRVCARAQADRGPVEGE